VVDEVDTNEEVLVVDQDTKVVVQEVDLQEVDDTKVDELDDQNDLHKEEENLEEETLTVGRNRNIPLLNSLL
jgi:hypothetical protein